MENDVLRVNDTAAGTTRLAREGAAIAELGDGGPARG